MSKTKERKSDLWSSHWNTRHGPGEESRHQAVPAFPRNEPANLVATRSNNLTTSQGVNRGATTSHPIETFSSFGVCEQTDKSTQSTFWPYDRSSTKTSGHGLRGETRTHCIHGATHTTQRTPSNMPWILARDLSSTVGLLYAPHLTNCPRPRDYKASSTTGPLCWSCNGQRSTDAQRRAKHACGSSLTASPGGHPQTGSRGSQ